MVLHKIKFIKNLSDIFLIKTGQIVTVDKQSYKVSKYTAIFFKYYYSAPVFFVIMFMFLLLPQYFDNLFLHFLETIFLYTIVEFLLFLLIPIYKYTDEP